MKHEIAAEWNGNETKVIARDTRRIQREWTAMGNDEDGAGGGCCTPDNTRVCKKTGSATHDALPYMKPAIICSRELFTVHANITNRTLMAAPCFSILVNVTINIVVQNVVKLQNDNVSSLRNRR